MRRFDRKSSRGLQAPSNLTERVTIVPHGALSYLPFNALHDSTAFVDERRSVREPAAAVLIFLKPTGGEKTGGLLAFGNPDLGDKR